jgi:hypothetical protein
VVTVRARTIRPDGSIVNFDGKVFEKELVKGRGVKILAKTFTLPDVQVGGIIEYFFTVDLVQEHFIFNSNWILSEELFTKKAQFSLKPYTSREPSNLRWSWNTLPAGCAPPALGPDRIVRMEANNIPAFQTEDHMPPADELKSRVDFSMRSSWPLETKPLSGRTSGKGKTGNWRASSENGTPWSRR